MEKIKLNILGLSYTQTQSGAYALLLEEENGDRRIPIIIGAFEAQSIAMHLEGVKAPRPLTHDLFVNMAIGFHINLIEVNIYKLEEGLFYSKIYLENSYNKLDIDARTSDAIALAIRFNCPIYTNNEILEKAGIFMDLDGKTSKSGKQKKKKQKKNDLSKKTLEELKKLMEQAINQENYEKASIYRDEINKRNK